MTHEILLAGFGGQGILFSGKFLAYDGLLEDKEVSWLPSYGPEMRGGTCNCSVILSDTKIGSPIVSNPNVLVAMNLPSLDKFENSAVPGAKIFAPGTAAPSNLSSEGRFIATRTLGFETMGEPIFVSLRMIEQLHVPPLISGPYEGSQLTSRSSRRPS